MKNLSIGLLIATLIACAPNYDVEVVGNNTEQHTRRLELPYTPDLPTITLGGGYNSHTGTTKAEICVEGIVEIRDTSTQAITTLYDLSRAKFEKLLNVNVGQGISSFEHNKKIVSELSANPMKSTFTIINSVSGYNQVLVPKVSGMFGVSEDCNTSEDSNFDRNRFGDSFISQISFGAHFILNTEIIFLNANAKRALSSGVVFSDAGIDFIVDADYSDSLKSNILAIEVSVLQLGGVFNTNNPEMADYPLTISCAPSDLSTCNNFIVEQLKHLKNGFSSQFISDEGNLQNFVPIEYTIDEYWDSGLIRLPAKIVVDALNMERFELVKSSSIDNQILIEMTELKYHSGLEPTLATLYSNQNILNDIVRYCFDDITKCDAYYKLNNSMVIRDLASSVYY